MAELNKKNLLEAVLRNDLLAFVAKVFQEINPGTPYLENWHIEAIIDELLCVEEGFTHRLAITQPPRSLKSICTSVAWVAWLLGHDPSKKIICVSYSQDLADELARQFRLVVNSDWYRTLFPGVKVTRDSAAEFRTSKGGGRIAVSVGGALTGIGADIIIIDDPMKAEEATSETARRRVIDWFGGTLLSRLDNKKEGAIVLVMQRLHEDDLAGHVLRGEAGKATWRHLDLPAIAEEDQRIPLGDGRFHYRKQGDVLHPERESREQLDELKRSMGSLAFSAQYQQRPVPLDGNLIHREWIKRYDEAPGKGDRGVQIVQSWDCAASIGEDRDWSVCTTWAMWKRSYYLIDVWRGRVEFPELRRKVVELARQHEPNAILIEDASAGTALLQELRTNPAQGVPVPTPIRPKLDKVTRLAQQAARFEAGQIFFPKEAPWLAGVETELLGFPNARHDDQVDSITQFLGWAESRARRRRGRPTPNSVRIVRLHDPDRIFTSPSPFDDGSAPLICSRWAPKS